jgi:amino acid transporter
MVAAAGHLPHGQVFAMVLLIATAASLLKAWNGVFMMAVRLLIAMARAGCVPAVFARLHPRFHSPVPAILAAGACNIAGIFLGKGAIEPITDMSAMVLTLTYGLCCWTVLRIRRRGITGSSRARSEPATDGNLLVPGGRWLVWIALIGSALMAACAFLTPFWQQPGFPLEYQLLAAWGLIGFVVWRYALSHPSGPDSPSTPAPL